MMASSLVGLDLPAKPPRVARSSYKDALLRRYSSSSTSSFRSLDEPLPLYKSTENLPIPLGEKPAAVQVLSPGWATAGLEQSRSLALSKRINLMARAVISDPKLPANDNPSSALAAVLRFQLGSFSWAWQHRSEDLLEYCLAIFSSGGALETSISPYSRMNCFGAILQGLLLTIESPQRRAMLAARYYNMFTQGPERPRNPSDILISVCDLTQTHVGIKVRNHPEDTIKLPRRLRRDISPGDILAISYYTGKRPTYPAPHYCCVSQSNSSKQNDIRVYSLWEDNRGSLTECTLSHLLYGEYAKADIAVFRPSL